MLMTAAVLAEICSALPLSGSIYIWAAESAGPKYARFFGFIVAWWACTAWMTFTASNCQVSICILKLLIANLNLKIPADNSQLHRLSDCRLGNRVPGWYRKWECQVESSHLGHFRRTASGFSCYQLPPSKNVFRHFQVWGGHYDARFFPLPYLASNRGFQNLWI